MRGGIASSRRRPFTPDRFSQPHHGHICHPARFVLPLFASPGPRPCFAKRLSPACQPPVVCSKGDGEGPGSLGPHGPKLLPRPVLPKGSDLPRPGGPGGGGGPGRSGDRKLASLIAYSGLVGTLAIGLARLSGTDIWAEFRWSSLDDLQLALLCSVPLQLLNGGLLLPSFGSDRPAGLKRLQGAPPGTEERQPAASKRAAAGPAAAEDASAPLGASDAAEPSSPVAASAPAAVAQSIAGTTPCTQQQAGPADAAQAQRTDATSPSPSPRAQAAAQPPSGALAAEAWGSGEENGGWRTPWGTDLTVLQAALHMAQGYYVHNNPTARLSPGLEAGVSLLETAAGEMLYRGVVLTWLAKWLEDRVYEAGLDELIIDQLPAAATHMGDTGAEAGEVVSRLGVYGLCECVVAATVVSYVVWSVISRSQRATRRLELLMGAVTSAAKKASRSARSSKGGASGGASGGSANSNAATGEGGKGGPAKVQMAFGAGAPPLGVDRAAKVMQGSAAIQATRDGFQVLLLNGIFIATGGNLAASFAASLTNQLLIGAMQRRAAARMQKANEQLARELLDMTDKMKQRNAGAKAASAAVAAAALEEKLPSVDAVVDSAAASSDSATSGSDADAEAPSAQPARVDAAAAAPLSDAGAPFDALPATVQAADRGLTADGPHMAGVGTSGGSAVAAGTTGGRHGNDGPGLTAARNSSSSLGRTLSMLDQLVPDPPKLSGAKR